MREEIDKIYFIIVSKDVGVFGESNSLLVISRINNSGQHLTDQNNLQKFSQTEEN